MESARDDALLQRKVVEDQADTIRSLQAQVQQLRESAQHSAEKDRDSARQVEYLSLQRRELQQSLDELHQQQSDWRDRDRDRKVRLLHARTAPHRARAHRPSFSLTMCALSLCAQQALVAQVDEQREEIRHLRKQIVCTLPNTEPRVSRSSATCLTLLLRACAFSCRSPRRRPH